MNNNNDDIYYKILEEMGEIKERLGKVEGNVEWIKKLLAAIITAIIGVFISVMAK